MNLEINEKINSIEDAQEIIESSINLNLYLSSTNEHGLSLNYFTTGDDSCYEIYYVFAGGGKFIISIYGNEMLKFVVQYNNSRKDVEGFMLLMNKFGFRLFFESFDALAKKLKTMKI